MSCLVLRVIFFTSPMFVGVAPISCWRLRMSLVGPAIREVPVSTMAWQPVGQKDLWPCTATLRHTHIMSLLFSVIGLFRLFDYCVVVDERTDGTLDSWMVFRSDFSELNIHVEVTKYRNDRPVHLYLPVCFGSHWEPIDWPSKQGLVYSAQQQFTFWVVLSCSPMGKQELYWCCIEHRAFFEPLGASNISNSFMEPSSK